MKQGKNLTELAQELERQQTSKRDFIVPTEQMNVIYDAGASQKVRFGDEGPFGINEVAHDQFSDRLGIPKRYYDRMRVEAPGLLITNINTWLHQNQRNAMVRTLDGSMRAFLSDRYRPLDNFDLCEVAFPVLAEAKVEVISCEVTEKRLYIQATCPDVIADDPKPKKVGDLVRAGVVISNSEVGVGSLRVEPLIYRLACLNGVILGHALKKFHVGRKHEGEEDIWEVLTTEARKADDKAFFLKARDIIRAAFDREIFTKNLERMKIAARTDIVDGADLQKIVEITTSRFSLTDGEGAGVLTRLIKEGDLSQYGLGNAVTALANETKHYDRAIDLERIGGEVWMMPSNDWSAINRQAMV